MAKVVTSVKVFKGAFHTGAGGHSFYLGTGVCSDGGWGDTGAQDAVLDDDSLARGQAFVGYDQEADRERLANEDLAEIGVVRQAYSTPEEFATYLRNVRHNVIANGHGSFVHVTGG